MSKSHKHLFELFKPENYVLSINLDKDNLRFTGEVIITGQKTGRPSKRLTFHQRDLKISGAEIIKFNKFEAESITPSRIVTHKAYDEVRIHTDQELYTGKYQVKIAFSGAITESMLGIYPSNFTYQGKNEVIIATQFESHYAREAFPCIDEPIAKATFNLTLTTKKGDIVLSNTSVLSEESNTKTTTTKFETTPKMSTYLLAFVTGPMHCVEAKTSDGILVRSWSSIARPKKELQYSVDEAVRVLDFFTNYFGVAYPLEKCDQVALPDFDAGAMENWGLITYREVALLSDPDNPSVSGEQYISLVIAHELSHQWFGNLVTMKWWDDLWLNESFASLMEHIALDAIHPDWRQWEFYTATDVLATSSRDIYKDIQPVGVKVTDPELIDTLFDPSIVYAKGGRLLKMLREYIGDKAFRMGLKIYFEKHAYGNTTRDDLWQAMATASGKDICALMTPWIERPGMPVVTVDQDKKLVKLSQKRFVLDNGDDPSIWPVPLLANQDLQKDLLTKQTNRNYATTDKPVILNQFGSGHYFTLYKDDAHKAHLANAIQKRNIPAETRINLLNDSLILARGGLSSLVDSLKLIAHCGEEDRDNVWALISRAIATASQLTEGNEATDDKIKSFKIDLSKNWYQKLGWEDHVSDDPNTKQLRHTIIAFMLGGEDQNAIKNALNIYNSNKDLMAMNAELRPSILSTAVRHGSKNVVADLIKQYVDAPADLQTDITSALSSTKDAKIAKDTLSQALGDNGFVRPQDIMRWLAMFLRSRYTRTVAWDYITSNWDWLEDTLAKSKSFDYLPVYCANVMNNKDWETKYHELFESKLTDKTLERNIKVGFSDISARVAWRERDEQAINNFFEIL
jgi:aminopeptidase N